MVDGDVRTWKEILAHLRRAHPAMCRHWFEQLDFLGISNGVMRVRAHTAVHRDYLQRECVAAFTEAAQTTTGRLVSVRFLDPEDDPRATPAGEATGGPAPYVDDLVINPDNSFENFVIGPGNRLAHAAAVAVADQPGRSYNPLFVHGGVGLGKTHLLQAICLRLRERHPNLTLHYTSCDAFRTHYFDAVQGNRLAEFQRRYRGVQALIIDDVHYLARYERTQEEFFHTFNSLYQAGRQIVLSSDAPPEEIPQLEARLVSRFKQGLVAEVQRPDFETRVGIVRKKASLRGLTLPDDVVLHVAARIDSNIRELEGAITKMQMQAQLDGKAVPDLATARAALGEVPASAPVAPSIHTVISVVAEYYGVRLTDLQSKRRPRWLVLPRQVCMYLARTHTRHSLEEIGGHLGGRDHTTVIHAVRTIEERRRHSPDLMHQLQTLEEMVRRRLA